MRTWVFLLTGLSLATVADAADARLGSADFAGQVHASTLLPLGSNDVLVAWFQGSREGRDDVTIWGAARRDGTWETPRQIVQVREEPHWNPVLRRGADGRICLYFKVGRKISDWQTYLAESRDEGRTWSAPRELVAGDVTGGRGPVKNKCLRLKGGRLLAPASRENGPWRAFVDISDDDGRTWRPSREMPGKAGVIQPTLWQGADGAVHALLRSDTGFICRSDSTDGGETWSELVRTKLPNNNSGIDLVAASDGRLYLAMNPISGNWASRDTLDLLVSDDGGANWRNFRRLVGPDEKAEYSYPAVVELRPGVLGVTYTWRRRQIAFVEIDLSAAAGRKADEMTCADYEARVRAVGSIPPVLKTAGLENYSSNRLAYVLMNALEMTRGGRIWLNWISGGDGAESFTAGCWSDDGGKTFTDVNFVIDSHGQPATARTNIVGCYWCDPDGVLHCFTDQSLFHYDCRAGIWEMTCANPDDAKPTWSRWRRIANGHLINKPIILRNGDWAFAAYLQNGGMYGTGCPKTVDGLPFRSLDGERSATCFVSSDRGKTWERRGTVTFPSTDWNEAQLLERKDGTLQMFARVDCGKVGLMASESRDCGRTWNAPHEVPGMNNTNARFQILRLKSGRILFVCHGRPDENCGRRRLTAWLSDDECATWKGGLQLEDRDGSYPDAFQAPDGAIYVAHDYGRGSDGEIWIHRFTEEDVLAGKVVSPNSRLGTVAFRAMQARLNRNGAKGMKSGK